MGEIALIFVLFTLGYPLASLTLSPLSSHTYKIITLFKCESAKHYSPNLFGCIYDGGVFSCNDSEHYLEVSRIAL